ncbi:zinc dependent phospholipase C family protein [Sporomusa acidovorans]|uniref:Phospholipase C n=1 Tax=Sporomusa acidovorans (strain ATCC 49682 / DSM 3132 / Mol) TaxID=1123286 RepID=A0ABZ3J2B4_SPOA4|nr:zinc dependent phospholipase C family protein [Sporomusa acidovorans]OZC24105.1 phospholipase C precursor [Sporomusa acidovorans DSM 3132]SDF69214.1 phospholipase C [Sporomusa acidovorans]
MIITTKQPSAETCLHLVLTAMSPLQNLVDKPGLTHEFCNRQALSIIKNDGFEQTAVLLTYYLAELNAGVYWADKDWKNIHHYFEPCSNKGLWHFTNALENFDMYYRLALQYAAQNNFKEAVFFLGAAAHLLQDLCVPHHARAKLFNGHKQFEIWVQNRCCQFAVSTQGMYQEKPQSLILNNAHIAADFFDWVRYEGDDSLYNMAAEVLLPLAQKTTAGLFQAFVTDECCLDFSLHNANYHPHS